MLRFYESLRDYSNYKQQTHEVTQIKKRNLSENLEQKNNAIVLGTFYHALHNYPSRNLSNPYPISIWADCWNDADQKSFEEISMDRKNNLRSCK